MMSDQTPRIAESSITFYRGLRILYTEVQNQTYTRRIRPKWNQGLLHQTNSTGKVNKQTIEQL